MVGLAERGVRSSAVRIPPSNLMTKRIIGWELTHPGLIADFGNGDYFTAPTPHD